MIYVGIDPSLTGTGLAVIDTAEETIHVEVVKTKAKGHERVQHILGAVERLGVPATGIGIEGMAYGAKGSAVSAIFGLWGIVSHHLWRHVGPYIVIPPTTRAKYATGRGNANKDLVLSSVVRRYPQAPVTDNNEADALVIAAMVARFHGNPIEVGLAADCLAAMDGIQIPDDFKDVFNR